MSQQFLSVAIWQALPGMEEASVVTIHALSALVAKKGYGHDHVYRSADSQYLLLRYWKSEEARQAALEDPELLRCWARLGNEIRTLKVYEKLENLDVSVPR